MKILFNTPILFIIFNRPEITIETWNEIKRIKPKTLYIAADGPRRNNKEDVISCNKVREITTKDIDWECDLHLLFQKENLGCGVAIKTAISWFFTDVLEGIIIEDDCKPDLDFFNFCSELLIKYRDTEEIFMISGKNVSTDYILPQNADYSFTYTPSAWGWATWRRSWEKYDFYLNGLDDFKKEKIINKIFTKKSYQNYWLNFFQEIKNKKINNWDYQLAFTSFKHKGLCIRPKYDLVSNLGITIANGGKKLISSKIRLKITNHPSEMIADKLADKIIMDSLVGAVYKVKLILKQLKIFYFIKKIYKKL